MVTILERVENLKAELNTLRPLDELAEQRIMQKFRLDWNYHSNHLEGTQLTYGETKALILFGITAQGKSLKDHLEITGHNEAIELVIEVIKDKYPLTETFIRQLHTLLLKKPYYVDAITLEGKSTKRLIEIGKYKSYPNHVLTQTGETFYFASPEETPAKMTDLIKWYRTKKERKDVNPIILAAEFHYKFIRIHPFDDGNGRLARILMNFILMQFDYPPVIIKTEDKNNYLSVLQQADAGIFEPFVEYIANNLQHSLEIMIKGAKGESIEEPDDLDKELALLEQKIKGVGQNFEVTRNKEVLLNLFEQVISPLLYKYINYSQKFDRFYASKSCSVGINNYGTNFKNFEDLESIIKRELNDNTSKLIVHYNYNSFNYAGFEGFSNNFFVEIMFNITSYKVWENYGLISYEKPYTEYLNPEEINEFVTAISKKHKDIIEEELKKAKLE